MRLADLENIVKAIKDSINELIKVCNELNNNQNELLKRVEVLEHAHETSSVVGNS